MELLGKINFLEKISGGIFLCKNIFGLKNEAFRE